MTFGLWQMLMWLFIAYAWWFGAKALAGAVLHSRARWATLIVSCALTAVAWVIAAAWTNLATAYIQITGLVVSMFMVLATLLIDPAVEKTEKAVRR